MRYWAIFAMAAMLLSGLSAIADEKPADEASDQKRIIGTWILVSSDPKNDVIGADGQKAELKFETDTFSFVVLKDGGKVLELGGSYVIDSTLTPKTIDITIRNDGTNIVFALYEFKDGNLRIRVGGENTRPADFETPAADCQTLVFRRDEPAK